MFETPRGFRGMFTAPHHLATEAGMRILRAGGNAAEAMLAAAATIAVVYPHMNAIGGDGFWILAAPGDEPLGSDASGAAAGAIDAAYYRARGHATIPTRGPLAANTVAGTLSGWDGAKRVAEAWGGGLGWPALLEEAIGHARAGAPVTASQARFTADKREECAVAPGFTATFLVDGKPPAAGTRFRQPALAETLAHIAARGPDDFYRGALARRVAADLARVGSPVGAADLERHRARTVRPLALDLAVGTVFNMPPPTQGLASLLILGLYERMGVTRADGPAHLHALVEATKLAFRVRDAEITDPDFMTARVEDLLSPANRARLLADFDPARALPWPMPAQKGDTIWMGCIDGAGRAASFIQSIYWEFGSACVLADTGILWQNRGASFALAAGARQELRPGRRPFHTLNPAFARLADGRAIVYGTMGGDGQPQTQAQIFTRAALFGETPQAAVAAPRFLLGRTWGAATTRLRIEARVAEESVAALAAAGHDLELVAPFTDLMGHAGMVVRHADGLLEGGSDPRSDGAVGAY